MDIIRAEELVKELMDKHLGNGINYWNFKWSHAKRVFGVCQYGGRVHRIKLSKPLTLLNDEARVRNTILHEIAHALDYENRGSSSHDQTWVRLAKSIGCDGKRCYSGANKPVAKYTLVCGTCDNTIPKHRRPKREIACGVCCREHNGGKFTTDYLMGIKLN